MESKRLGVILIVVSIIFLAALIVFKIQVNNLTEMLMIETGGTCIQNGICIHEQSDVPVYIGGAVVFIALALGFYLLLFEKSREDSEMMHKDIVDSLKETKKKQDKDEKFEFLLKALNEDERKIMRAVKEQEGVEQATLRIRTDLSKTKLSVILTELEKKGLVKKVPKGKKNRIYLKNAF